MNEKIRFLLVDDEPNWNAAMQHPKSAAEYDITYAQSLREVQELLNSGRQFDAAWVDLGLGDWDSTTTMRSGEDAAERIHEQTGAKIGIVTGWPGEESKKIAKQLRAILIEKTDIESLPSVINRILAGPS